MSAEASACAPPSSAASPAAVVYKLTQAVGCQQAGDLPRARQLYEEVLALRPDHVHALHALGVMAYTDGRSEEAADLFGRAVAVYPDDAQLQGHLGHVLMVLRRWPDALACFERVIESEPEMATAHADRATVLQIMGHTGEAVASYDRAIALAPTPGLFTLRGLALRKLGRYDEALADHDRAIAWAPEAADAYVNRGVFFQDQGWLDQAIADYERALAISPDLTAAQYNKACSLLLKGDYEQGWALYESRWQVRSARHQFTQPLWLGQEAVQGKTVLLHAEQGLGDSIMLCRFARQVRDRGAKVILGVPAQLLNLFRDLEGVSELVPYGAQLPAFDYYCPLFSLPLALQVRVQSIPGRDGYLKSDPDKVRHWGQRLGATDKLRVGLAWSGNPTHDNDHKRSIALDAFMAALSPTCEFVSLQQTVRESDGPALAAHPALRHFGADLHDLTDTAALCEQMDLVVSVDTCVAHLAGALGKPTWILLPFAPDYRWLCEGEDCPWYANARLLRQDSRRDWATVLARVRADLEALASRQRPLDP